MSPLIFVLVLEYLSRCLSRNIPQSFKFHHGCQVLRLNHLCFADDLIVFCGYDMRSLEIIATILNHFKQVSGLKVNEGKSCIFFSGASLLDKQRALSILKFEKGTLPVKYLGVPLISSSLTKAHYQILMDRITAKLDCWTSRFLSYARRLQLINVVI